MKVKAIFFDIDGTLVSFKTHRIPNTTCEALKVLRQQGIKIFIATGRPWVIIDNIGNCLFDGYITMNGCSCFTADFQPIYKSRIPKNDVQRLIDSGLTKKFAFCFASDHDIFVTCYDERVKAISDKINLPPTRIGNVEEALEKAYYQMMGYFTTTEEQELNIFEDILPHCQAMRWHPLFADIITKGNNKSTGIDNVLNYYGIPLAESMAFGDGGNDIPMLQHAAIGIAMGNAEQAIKDVADYVTDNVDNDGIANALHHFGLI